MYTLKTHQPYISVLATIFEFALNTYVVFSVLLVIGMILIDNITTGMILATITVLACINYLFQQKRTQQISIDPEHITVTYSKLFIKRKLVLDTKQATTKLISWEAIPKARGVSVSYFMIQIRDGMNVLYETELNPKLRVEDCQTFINYHKLLREGINKVLLAKQDQYFPIHIDDNYWGHYRVF